MNLVGEDAFVLSHDRGKFAATRLAERRNGSHRTRHLSRMEGQRAPEVPENKQNKLLAKWSGVSSFILCREMH